MKRHTFKMKLKPVVVAEYKKRHDEIWLELTADLKNLMFYIYMISGLAGTCWYFQFFFYTMGATQMGKYDFASWTLHMASIIIFSTMWGWILREWKGASKKAHLLIAGGIATLILSTIVIGWGTYLKSR
jgi:L-rhamnose-H+ transport protein